MIKRRNVINENSGLSILSVHFINIDFVFKKFFDIFYDILCIIQVSVIKPLFYHNRYLKIASNKRN